MTSLFNWFGSVLGYLLWFFYNLVHNYGIAIIIFTIATKILLFPFSVKQQKSMAANSKMAAKQREIQKKYAKDPQKLRDETQKLYEQENYNPGSGCLTTLIPFPIMLGIYYTVLYPLQNALHVNMDSINKATEMIAKIPGLGASFTSNYAQMEIMKHFDVVKDYLTVFTQDELARIASLSDGFNFFGMNLLNSPNSSSFSTFMWLIPVLCLLSSWLMQYFTMKLQPGMEQAQQGPMKMMLYAMPLFTAYLAYTMPGAVGFYWITQTLVSFVQTIILNLSLIHI